LRVAVHMEAGTLHGGFIEGGRPDMKDLGLGAVQPDSGSVVHREPRLGSVLSVAARDPWPSWRSANARFPRSIARHGPSGFIRSQMTTQHRATNTAGASTQVDRRALLALPSSARRCAAR